MGAAQCSYTAGQCCAAGHARLPARPSQVVPHLYPSVGLHAADMVDQTTPKPSLDGPNTLMHSNGADIKLVRSARRLGYHCCGSWQLATPLSLFGDIAASWYAVAAVFQDVVFTTQAVLVRRSVGMAAMFRPENQHLGNPTCACGSILYVHMYVVM